MMNNPWLLRSLNRPTNLEREKEKERETGQSRPEGERAPLILELNINFGSALME